VRVAHRRGPERNSQRGDGGHGSNRCNLPPSKLPPGRALYRFIGRGLADAAAQMIPEERRRFRNGGIESANERLELRDVAPARAARLYVRLSPGIQPRLDGIHEFVLRKVFVHD
jgi:hypothetical protein